MLTSLRNCARCGALCRVGEPSRPDAKMLRRTSKPAGLCVNCAVREWFFIYQHAVPDLDPRELLVPHIRQQFEAVMHASRAGADPTEIDWEKVVRDWDLPIPNADKHPYGRKVQRANWSPPLPGGEDWN